LLYFLWSGSLNYQGKKLLNTIYKGKDILLEDAPKEISDLVSKILKEEPTERPDIFAIARIVRTWSGVQPHVVQ
jgi:hypothetical protein